MMMYGHVYVAQISLGAQLNQTVKAIQEAEAYPGPSLIIAYSPCEEHGYDLALSHDQMSADRHRLLAALPLRPTSGGRRQDPAGAGLSPTVRRLAETLLNEQRFRRLNAQQPEVAEQLWKMLPPTCRSATTSSPSWLAKRRNHRARAKVIFHPQP
jgi:pyruvate/2-oxoacid:ferredoxin oxidoreductase beta subunit